MPRLFLLSVGTQWVQALRIDSDGAGGFHVHVLLTNDRPAALVVEHADALHLMGIGRGMRLREALE